MNNSITVVGYVGNDLLVNNYPSGNKRVYFPVAVREYAKKGEEPGTLWLDVESWNGVAERAASTLTKGREVVISGRLAVSKYKKTVGGQEVELTRPVIRMISFHACGPRPAAMAEGEAATSEASSEAPAEANAELATA